MSVIKCIMCGWCDDSSKVLHALPEEVEILLLVTYEASYFLGTKAFENTLDWNGTYCPQCGTHLIIDVEEYNKKETPLIPKSTLNTIKNP